jgi:lysophospholipase L1-like esterase
MRGWLMLKLAVALLATGLVAATASFVALHSYKQLKIGILRPVASNVFVVDNARIQPRDNNGNRLRIVLIGDSRIAHWTSFGAKRNWQIVNRGVSGESAAQLAFRFAQDAIELDPDVIVMQSGINDLVAASLLGDGEAQLVVRKTEDTLKRLAADAAGRGIRVLLTTVIPPGTPDLLRRIVWNDAVRDDVARLNIDLVAWPAPAGVSVLDLSPFFGTTTIPRPLQFDTLHLNEQGYAHFSAIVDKGLAELLAQEPATIDAK